MNTKMQQTTIFVKIILDSCRITCMCFRLKKKATKKIKCKDSKKSYKKCSSRRCKGERGLKEVKERKKEKILINFGNFRFFYVSG